MIDNPGLSSSEIRCRFLQEVLENCLKDMESFPEHERGEAEEMYYFLFEGEWEYENGYYIKGLTSVVKWQLEMLETSYTWSMPSVELIKPNDPHEVEELGIYLFLVDYREDPDWRPDDGREEVAGGDAEVCGNRAVQG